MAAPTNITPATATDLGTLPASVSQNVFDAGTAYTVWFAYTSVSPDVMVSLFAYGDAIGYYTGTQVYDDISASPVSNIISTGVPPTVTTGNKPVQFAVTPGTTYYIKISPPTGNPSPAVLTLEVESFAQQTAPIGSIVVPDDTLSVATIISASGGALRFLNPFPPGESADVLDDGTMAFEDSEAGGVSLYDDQFNLIATAPTGNVNDIGGCIRTCQGTQRFWVAYRVGADRVVSYIDPDGTLGPTHTLPTSPKCIAVSNDESICYYSLNGDSVIKRFDLLTDTPLSDLVADTPTFQTFDILVLSDDTIIASYLKTFDVKVRAFNPAGTVLHTYSFGGDVVYPSGTQPRLAYAADDPTSFWIWTHPDGVNLGLSRFQNVTVATGAIAATVENTEYETGIYNRAPTPTPVRNGNSYSCPFLITRVAVPSSPTGTGTIRVVKVVVGTDPTGTFTFTAGGGLSPTTFTLTDGDEQVFNSLEPGTYSISEEALACFTSLGITVSNGSPVDAITVAEDEVVVVTFTNGQIIGPNCGAPPGAGVHDPIRWVRRTPTIFSDGKRVFHRRLQVDMQVGVGLSVAADEHDHDPIILQRQSDDNGMTWSSFREMTMGAQGNYLKIARLFQLGAAYNRVYELSGDSPVKFCLVQAFLDIEGGDH